MKTLQGTEKQIKWAESIREKVISYYNESLTKAINEQAAEKIAALFDKYIFGNANAGWWIDHRFELESWRATIDYIDYCMKNNK